MLFQRVRNTIGTGIEAVKVVEAAIFAVDHDNRFNLVNALWTKSRGLSFAICQDWPSGEAKDGVVTGPNAKESASTDDNIERTDIDVFPPFKQPKSFTHKRKCVEFKTVSKLILYFGCAGGPWRGYMTGM